MQRVFELLRLYTKYLILVPLFLLAVAASTYVTERAVNRYYVERDLRLLAASAEQLQSDYQSRQLVEKQRPPKDDPSRACAGRVTTEFLNSKAPTRRRPPGLREKLGEHVRPLIQRNLFTSVLVAEQDGDVIAQEPSSGPRFSNIAGLLRSAKHAHAGTNKEDADTDFALFAKATNVREIDFAGQGYWIFAQPFRAFRDAEWNNEESLVMVGLLPSRSLWSAPLEFTRRSWVVALLGTLAVLAFWPLLKLWQAKPGADLQPFEVFRFVFSVLTLTSIATFGVLYLALQHQRELNIDYRLEQLAAEVREESGRELNRAVKQLNLFDKDPNLDLSKWEERLDMSGTDYKLYDAATWIDQNGCQLIQYVKERIGYAQDLKDREYFKEVRHYGPWKVKLGLDGGMEDVVIEAVRSRATALPAAALAIESSKPLPGATQIEEKSSAPVAVLTIPFESVMKPVLPDDYGFALVDSTGKVHFHSDPSRGAGENILIETGNDALLYASLVRRNQKTFSLQYQGSPHRVHVTRFLLGTPWSLVVFHDLAQGRRLQLETLLNAMIIFAIYAGCMMGFTALLYRVRYMRREKKLGTWRLVAEDWAEDWLMAFHTRSPALNMVLSTVYILFLLLLCVAVYALESVPLLLFTLVLQIVATVIAWVPTDEPGTADHPQTGAAGYPDIRRHFRSRRTVPAMSLLTFSAVVLYTGTGSSQPLLFALMGACFVALSAVIGLTQPQRKAHDKPNFFSRLSYLVPAALLCVLTGMASCFVAMVVSARHSEYVELRTAQLTFAYAFDQTLRFTDWTQRDGLYDKAIAGSELQPVSAAGITGSVEACLPRDKDDTGGWTDLWGLITDFRLASSRNLQSSTDLHNDATHDGSWGWCPQTDEERQRARTGDDPLTFQRIYTRQLLIKNQPVIGFQIKSVMPGKMTLQPISPSRREGQNRVWRYWVVLAAIAGLLTWALHAVLRRCLMSKVRPTCVKGHSHKTMVAEPTENTLILLPAFHERPPMLKWQGWCELDLRSIESNKELRKQARCIPAQACVLIRHVQAAMAEDSMALSLLDLLEDLASTSNRKIVMMSTVHPVHFLTTNGPLAPSGSPRYTAEYLARWTTLMERFVTELYTGDEAADGDGRGAWLECSRQEQAVLRHVAWNSLAHPRYRSIMQELFRRRLVVRDPVSQLLLVDTRISKYAEGSTMEAAVAKEAKVQAHRMGIGTAVGACAVLVVLALFAFEQDLATKLAGLLSGVIGIPVALNKWLSSESVRERKTEALQEV